MAKDKKKTEEYLVSEWIVLSYANLAMAHAAVVSKQPNYTRLSYMIRAKLQKGLSDGTMNIRTLFDDEKVKLSTGQICSYCGSTHDLALDHLFPKKFGGRDTGDNLIYACKSCNSSKGKKDLMEWMNANNKFPPLLILRRHLKLVYYFCKEFDLLEKTLREMQNADYPFRIELLPIAFPKPSELVLNANEIT